MRLFQKPSLRIVSGFGQSTELSGVINFAICANVCTTCCAWRVQSTAPGSVCDAAKSPDLEGSSPSHRACEQSRMVTAAGKDPNKLCQS